MVPAIPSKSELHRALIASALSGTRTLPFELPEELPEDILATREALESLRSPHNSCVNELNCRESASTLRMLLPVAATRQEMFSFTGQGRLPQRPLFHLTRLLREHGAQISSDQLPLTLRGPLRSGRFRIPGNISSQYITGLLFALPLLSEESIIELETPLESAAYIDMTLQTLALFGIRVEPVALGWRVPGKQLYQRPSHLVIGGDWSNAAVWLCAGALSGPVTVTGLDRQTHQGDAVILEYLRQFGAQVACTSTGVTVARQGTLHPIEADLRNAPDLLPVLAVTACGAEGTSVFTHLERLRLKESDRLEGVAFLIQSLGGQCVVSHNSLIINGLCKLKGGVAPSLGDHRLVMASLLASLLSELPVEISTPEAIAKSFPQFWRQFEGLKISKSV